MNFLCLKVRRTVSRVPRPSTSSRAAAVDARYEARVSESFRRLELSRQVRQAIAEAEFGEPQVALPESSPSVESEGEGEEEVEEIEEVARVEGSRAREETVETEEEGEESVEEVVEDSSSEEEVPVRRSALARAARGGVKYKDPSSSEPDFSSSGSSSASSEEANSTDSEREDESRPNRKHKKRISSSSESDSNQDSESESAVMSSRSKASRGKKETARGKATPSKARKGPLSQATVPSSPEDDSPGRGVSVASEPGPSSPPVVVSDTDIEGDVPSVEDESIIRRREKGGWVPTPIFPLNANYTVKNSKGASILGKFDKLPEKLRAWAERAYTGIITVRDSITPEMGLAVIRELRPLRAARNRRLEETDCTQLLTELAGDLANLLSSGTISLLPFCVILRFFILFPPCSGKYLN